MSNYRNRNRVWRKIAKKGSVCLFLVCFLLSNFTVFIEEAGALSPWLAFQKVSTRREIYADLEKTRVICAETEAHQRLLETNREDILLLPSGKYLVSKELYEDDIRLVRAIIRKDIKALMRILLRDDRYRYNGIKDLLLNYPAIKQYYFDLCHNGREPRHLTPELLLNDIVAKALEIMFVAENGFVREGDYISEEERVREARFYLSIRPLIMANKHNYFREGLFVSAEDTRIRQRQIRKAMDEGFLPSDEIYRADPGSGKEVQTTDDLPFLPERRSVKKEKINLSLAYLSKPENPEKVVEPLGLESIAGYVNRKFDKSVSVSTTIAHRYKDIDDVIRKIHDEKPDVLGLSVFFDTLEDLDRILGSIDQLPAEERPLVLLGNVVAAHNCELLLNKYPNVVICCGNGELATSGVIEYLRGEKDLSEVANIAYRKKDGEIFYAKKEIPPISVPDRFALQDVIDSGGKAYIETSRGCPFNCNFCERKGFFGHGRVEKPLEDVLEEIVYLSQRGFKSIDIVDEDFISDNPDRAICLARSILDLKTRGVIPDDLTFFGSISAKAVYNARAPGTENAKKKRALELLKEAGLKSCFIGIESGSSGQLGRYGKAQTIEEAKTAVGILLNEIGIKVEPGFIMFDPVMTLEELKENIAFLKETGLLEHISNPFSQLRVQVNTEMYRKISDRGLVIEGSYNPDWLTVEYCYENTDIAEIVRHAKEFESGVIFLENILKRVYRSNHFQALPEGVQQYVIRQKNAINRMFIGLLDDLADCTAGNGSVGDVVDKYNDILIEFLRDLLEEGSAEDAFGWCEDLKERSELLLVKKIIEQDYKHNVFGADDLLVRSGLTGEMIAKVFNKLADGGELEEIAAGIYKTGDKFSDLRLAIPADYPKPSRAAVTGDFSDVFDRKELAPWAMEFLRERFMPDISANGPDEGDDIIDNVFRVAHKLYLNPSIYSEELCDELDINKEELVRIFRIIHDTPFFHDLFLRHSMHGKYFDTLMFLLNTPEYVRKILKGEVLCPPEVELHLSLRCQRNCKHCFNQGAGYEDFPGGVVYKEKIFELLAGIKRNGGRMVNFSGGKEPTLNEVLPEIMERTHDLGLKFQLYSNGIELNGRINEALMRAERVRVSMDAATAETYAKISQVSRDAGERFFNKIVQNLQELIRLKHERNSSVRIGITFVTSPDNYKEIPLFLDMGKRLGVDFINISHDYMGHTAPFSETQLKDLKEIKEKAERDKGKGKYGNITIVFPETFGEAARTGKYSEGLRVPDLCRAPCFKIVMDPKGNFHPCCYYAEPGYYNKKYISGNIQEDTFEEIIRRGRELKIDPHRCAHCNDFDRYANVVLDKLSKDKEFGIDIDQQPFSSLLEYRAKDSNKDVASLEVLRRVYAGFGPGVFSLRDLLERGIAVSRKNIEELEALGLIAPAEAAHGKYEIADILRGKTPRDTERNIASIYNIKHAIGKQDRLLGCYRIPENEIPIIKELIKMELAHMNFLRALASKDEDRPSIIKLWKGYVPVGQEGMRTRLEKTTRKGMYQVDFEDIDDLVEFACNHGPEDTVVTILPYGLLTKAQERRIGETGARIVYMDFIDNECPDVSDMIQLEAIIAAGVAYLNNDVFSLLSLYRILTGERGLEYITMEQLKKDPTLLKFVLKPVEIFDHEEIRNLNVRMEELLQAA